MRCAKPILTKPTWKSWNRETDGFKGRLLRFSRRLGRNMPKPRQWSAGDDPFSPFDTGLVKVALSLVDTVYLDNSANAVSSDFIHQYQSLAKMLFL
jgi:hypothetical protein